MESQRPAKDKARDAAAAAGDAARAQAQSLFETNKQAAVSNAGVVAHALRSITDELGGEHSLGRFAQRAADRVEHAARSLEQRDLLATRRSLEETARRSPGLFYGGAFLAGIALARFLKASSERDRSGNAPYGSLPTDQSSF